uniref:Uncharacterized protein n=1 Tax=Anguilla anguilla TaxID=7936 RepID=A0A0E9X7D7_ANGAN
MSVWLGLERASQLVQNGHPRLSSLHCSEPWYPSAQDTAAPHTVSLSCTLYLPEQHLHLHRTKSTFPGALRSRATGYFTVFRYCNFVTFIVLLRH